MSDVIDLRSATEEDSLDIWRWRNDEVTRAMFKHQDHIDWGVHDLWFSEALVDRDKILLVGFQVNDGEKVGVVRFDCDGSGKAEVSINLNPDFRGKGLSKLMLNKSLDYLLSSGVFLCVSKVKKINLPSVNLFYSLGFFLKSQDQEYFIFEKALM